MIKAILKFFNSAAYLHGFQDGYTVCKLENLILLDRIKMLESERKIRINMKRKDKHETK